MLQLPWNVQDGLPQLETYEWLLPERVELVEGRRGVEVHSWHGDRGRITSGAHMRGALQRFLALHDAPDERVRAFIQAHGALQLRSRPLRRRRGIGLPIGRPLRERVEWYRDVATIARTALDAGAAARLERPLPREKTGHPAVRSELWTGHPMTAELVAARLANSLVFVAGVAPMLTWWRDRPVVGWTGGLAGVLATQLLASLQSRGGTPVCWHCQKDVKRRVRADAQYPWCGAAKCRRAIDAEKARVSRLSRRRRANGDADSA